MTDGKKADIEGAAPGKGEIGNIIAAPLQDPLPLPQLLGQQVALQAASPFPEPLQGTSQLPVDLLGHHRQGNDRNAYLRLTSAARSLRPPART